MILTHCACCFVFMRLYSLARVFSMRIVRVRFTMPIRIYFSILMGYSRLEHHANLLLAGGWLSWSPKYHDPCVWVQVLQSSPSGHHSVTGGALDCGRNNCVSAVCS
jgi:hypothetical protein